MKQLFFTVAFGLAALNTTANKTETKPVIVEQNTNVNESAVKATIIILERSEALDGNYRGVCLDGYTWPFTAGSDEEAQKIINDYCTGPRPNGLNELDLMP